MKFIRLLFLTCIFPFSLSHGQNVKDTLTFRVMSYNVENLFDCRHDSLKNDYEFMPDAIRHWTYSKYKKKLDNIARVITAVGRWSPPALVALCEVENDSVMRDLTQRSILREGGYQYAMTNSPDQRGIDVALLYQRGVFKLLSTQSIRIMPGRHKEFHPTRDILHVCGLLPDKDSLDVVVCHLPSRSGGEKQSEPYRIIVAGVLKNIVDSIMQIRVTPRILIMGDFNDYPNNKSIRQVLGAKAPSHNMNEVQSKQLYHLLAQKAADDDEFGSYKFQGEWGLLDHIIVSGSLLNKDSSFHTDPSKADVFHDSFILTDDERNGGKQPFRTYQGMKYIGGYSDHLPVWADFTLVY